MVKCTLSREERRTMYNIVRKRNEKKTEKHDWKQQTEQIECNWSHSFKLPELRQFLVTVLNT